MCGTNRSVEVGMLRNLTAGALIAIIGCMTVPNAAGFIVQPGGRDGLLSKTTAAAKTGALGGTRVIQQVIK